MRNETAFGIEAQVAAFAEACPVALIGLDAQGHIRVWNPGAEEIFKWAASEVLGTRLPIAESMEAELLCVPRDVLSLSWPTRENEVVKIRVRVAPWLDANQTSRKGVLLMITDRSSELRALEERAQLITSE